MADAYLGEIRIFGFSFAPNQWAQCNGQILPIQQYSALFSLLGTNYGGDGARTFALPNLSGTCVIGAGQSMSGSAYVVGDSGGETTTALDQQYLPAHTHTFSSAGARSTGGSNAPSATNALAKTITCTPYLPATPAPTAEPMAPTVLPVWGTNPTPSHGNMMAYNTVNFCIALSGIFPQRP